MGAIDLGDTAFLRRKGSLLPELLTCTGPQTRDSPPAGGNRALVLPQRLKKRLQRRWLMGFGGQGGLTEGLMALNILQAYRGTLYLAVVFL